LTWRLEVIPDELLVFSFDEMNIYAKEIIITITARDPARSDSDKRH